MISVSFVIVLLQVLSPIPSPVCASVQAARADRPASNASKNQAQKCFHNTTEAYDGTSCLILLLSIAGAHLVLHRSRNLALCSFCSYVGIPKLKPRRLWKSIPCVSPRVKARLQRHLQLWLTAYVLMNLFEPLDGVPFTALLTVPMTCVL